MSTPLDTYNQTQSSIYNNSISRKRHSNNFSLPQILSE